MTTLLRKCQPTVEILRELLTYDQNTGMFVWRTSRRVQPGDLAGSIGGSGYRLITIAGRSYRAHRLAWLYVYGEWPADQIDHINGDRADNRLCNLRVVSNRENQQNQRVHREGRLPGATFHKRDRKWQARIHVNGRLRHIGYYNTETDASAAYEYALSRAQGEAP